MRYDAIGIVAATQALFEAEFSISWNELVRPPYEIPAHEYRLEVGIESDDLLHLPEKEIIDMKSFAYRDDVDDIIYRFRVGYGEKSGQFIYTIPKAF